MAKLQKLRFLDTSEGKKDAYVEVYCDENNRRGYFRKMTKDMAKADNTTIKPNKDEVFEARLLGVGWKQVSRDKFQKQLKVINKERITNGWEPVQIPALN